MPQIRSAAQSHGWNLKKYEEKGLLKFVTPMLIDTYPDRLLHQVKKAADEIGAERMLIDSVSSIPSADMSEDNLRELLLELNSLLKARGITCIMTHLARSMFSENPGSIIGSTQASNLRLSSLTDGIILLRYVEEKEEISKAMNVLKMRGSKHSTEIRKFEITENGIKIGEALE